MKGKRRKKREGKSKKEGRNEAEIERSEMKK